MPVLDTITIDQSLSGKPATKANNSLLLVSIEGGLIKLIPLPDVSPRGMEDLGKVSAQAIAELLARVGATENLVNAVLRGDVSFDKILTEGISIQGAPLLTSGHGVPANAPDFVGQEYVDLDAKIAYKAVGNGSTGDWKPITNP